MRRLPPHSRPFYLPMADEIAAECRRIQSGWDETEKKKRAGLNPHARFTVPEVPFDWHEHDDDEEAA